MTMRARLVLTEPNPNVMLLSGELRDLPYRRGNETNRRLGLGDAIMLATCIHVQEAYTISFDAFHTFDKGGKKELRAIGAFPLLATKIGARALMRSNKL